MSAEATFVNPGLHLSLCGYNVRTTDHSHMTTRVNFRLPDELVEKADVAARISHKDRTEIVVEALHDYLREVENREEFKEAVVELYLDDEIEFDALREFVGRRDAESIRASRALLEQGEDLADDLASL